MYSTVNVPAWIDIRACSPEMEAVEGWEGFRVYKMSLEFRQYLVSLGIGSVEGLVEFARWFGVLAVRLTGASC